MAGSLASADNTVFQKAKHLPNTACLAWAFGDENSNRVSLSAVGFWHRDRTRVRLGDESDPWLANARTAMGPTIDAEGEVSSRRQMQHAPINDPARYRKGTIRRKRRKQICSTYYRRATSRLYL